MKYAAYILLLILIAFSAVFSAEKGELTPDMLKKIEANLKMDDATRAMMNAISNNDMKKLALSREFKGSTDHHFAHKIETGKVSDQKSSGRCWLFTSLNVLRPKIIKKYNLENFDFSYSYLYFYDLLEKSNFFLENIIETRDLKIDDRKVMMLFKDGIGDGGVWTMMVNLIKKYGVVPENAMPESYNSENTRMMVRLIRRKLREAGINIREQNEAGKKPDDLRKIKAETLADVYRILVLTLGQPPKSFDWRYKDKDKNLSEIKTYTPLEFYKATIETDVHNYVMLMDDPSREYYKYYEISLDRNTVEGINWTFVNLPVKEIKQYAKASILADEPMYFSCDVGKQLDSKDGYLAMGIYDYESLFGVKFNMDKKQRILTSQSGSTHGMALMGVDTSANGQTTKWLLENSWGSDSGHKGYLTMTDQWFDQYMFRLVVGKKFLPKKVLKISEQKPIVLPAWDPMF